MLQDDGAGRDRSSYVVYAYASVRYRIGSFDISDYRYIELVCIESTICGSLSNFRFIELMSKVRYMDISDYRYIDLTTKARYMDISKF